MQFIQKVKKHLEQIISLVFIILLEIYAYYFPGNKYKYYPIIILILFAIIAKWFIINNNKKSLLFYIGLIYITFPMIHWCININYIDTLILFVLITVIYNLLLFLLFKISDGIFTSINKKFLKIITSTFSAVFISYLTLRIKSLPDNCPISLYKDYLTISTLLFSVILLISNVVFKKIKPILDCNDIKELINTDSIIPTRGIYIKIVHDFLLISYIYIIYTQILYIIYRILINT